MASTKDPTTSTTTTPTASASRSSTRLWLVRHGETEWNAARRWQGHADPGLSEIGRAQAAALADRLSQASERPWTRLFVSDLARARETAAILVARLDLEMEVDRRIRELDVGDWSGSTRAEIEARDRDRLLAFEAGDLSIRPGGGESRVELAERARAFAAELAKRFPGEDLLVVTHLGIVRALAPGAEPTNADVTRVSADEVARGEAGHSNSSPVPDATAKSAL